MKYANLIIIFVFLLVFQAKGNINNYLYPYSGYTTNSNKITLRWNAIQNAKYYELIVSKDSTFSSAIDYNGLVNNDTFVFNFSSSGKFYWRVRPFVNAFLGWSQNQTVVYIDFAQTSNILYLTASNINQANNTSVSTWNDQSGSNNHASALTTSPSFRTNIFGTNPALLFSSNTLSCGNKFNFNGNLSFAILLQNPTPNGFQTYFSKSINSQGSIYLGNTNTGILNLFADVQQIQGTSVGNTKNLFMGVFKTNTDTQFIYKNGAQFLKYVPNVDFLGSNTENFTIGSSNGGLPLIGGYIAEMLLFNKALTAVEKIQVETYIFDKYTPKVSLGKDITTCVSNYIINAPLGYDSYLWSNGDTSKFISVNTTGSYSVRTKDFFNRFSFDTVLITFDTSNYKPQLPNDTFVCLGQNYKLLAGNPHLKYSWNTGDTTNTIAVNTSGTYIVNATNCKNNTFSDTINLYVSDKRPQLPDTASLCFNSSIKLSSLASGNLTYNWSNALTTPFIFVNTGGFYSLTVTDSLGCQFLDTIKVVTDSTLKNITLGADKSLCSGNIIQLLNGHPSINYYQWSNGSNNSSIQVTNSQNYWVQVKNINNCSYSDSINISIIGYAPTLSFKVDSLCSGSNTSFNDLSTPPVGNTITSRIWKFSSTDSSFSSNSTYSFSSRGTKSIYLKVLTNVGCFNDTIFNIFIYSKPTASYSTGVNCAVSKSYFDNLTQFDVLDTSNLWFWTFGDGSTSSQKNPNNSFKTNGKYGVQLITISKNNCIDTFIDSVVIYPPLQAKFGFLNTCIADSSEFYDSTQSLSLIYRKWSFGDNTYSQLKNAKHKYQNGGMYDVSLCIQNAIGCVDTMKKTIPIVSSPKAIITSSDACYRTPYRFTEGSTIGLNDSIVNYSWIIPSIDNFNVKNPIVQFKDTGNISLKLAIQTKFGCTDTTSKSIKVYPIPSANFQFSSEIGEAPITMTFKNNSVNADSYIWYFGNGDSSLLKTPTYTFTNNINYSISLQAMNTVGCVDIYRLTLPVKASNLDIFLEKLSLKEFKTKDSTIEYEMTIRIANIGSRIIKSFDLYINSPGIGTVIEHVNDSLFPGTYTQFKMNSRIVLPNELFKSSICVEAKNINQNQVEVTTSNNLICENISNCLSFQLMPNPAKDNTNLRIISPSDATIQINMTDYRGKVLFEKSPYFVKKGSNNINFDINNFEKGFYYFNIESICEKIVKKFIVE